MHKNGLKIINSWNSLIYIAIFATAMLRELGIKMKQFQRILKWAVTTVPSPSTAEERQRNGKNRLNFPFIFIFHI